MQKRTHKLVLARETVRVLTAQDLVLARGGHGGRDTETCDPVHFPDTVSPQPSAEPDPCEYYPPDDQ